MRARPRLLIAKWVRYKLRPNKGSGIPGRIKQRDRCVNDLSRSQPVRGVRRNIKSRAAYLPHLATGPSLTFTMPQIKFHLVVGDQLNTHLVLLTEAIKGWTDQA